MAKPTLIINGHDYSSFCEKLKPKINGLDADGSGRDVQTGKMFRFPITQKQTWEVDMLKLPENVASQLFEDMCTVKFYSAKVLSPVTKAVVTKSFYTQSFDFGDQVYDASTQSICYEGISFEMIEE